jgi:hypothetical protein
VGEDRKGRRELASIHIFPPVQRGIAPSSLNVLKRLGCNKNSFCSSLLKLAPDAIMEMQSYIRLRAFKILRNVFPSEFIG